ncbi:hypothetical protein [Pontibacter vulgaris]|uniref:hypothetical protein n=1 Tax=Pontibacter vulgaris TaxID=2905679 RepID=UPI001FA6AFC5|nr:hypothetical protein [Pontibacter vulgaris]
MPAKTYHIDTDNTLTLQWKFNWKNMTLSWNGEPLGVIDNQQQLKEGRSITLPNGDLLQIRLTGGVSQELEVLLNGTPLPGSATDPLQRVKSAFHLALFLGILNLAIGLLAGFVNLDILKALTAGPASIAAGILYIGLAFGIKRLYLVALYSMIGLLALDIILTLYLTTTEGTAYNPTSGILVKGFFIFILTKAVPAIKFLKTTEHPVS